MQGQVSLLRGNILALAAFEALFPLVHSPDVPAQVGLVRCRIVALATLEVLLFLMDALDVQRQVDILRGRVTADGAAEFLLVKVDTVDVLCEASLGGCCKTTQVTLMFICPFFMLTVSNFLVNTCEMQ